MGRARGASAQQPGHGSLTARSNSCAKLRVPSMCITADLLWVGVLRCLQDET